MSLWFRLLMPAMAHFRRRRAAKIKSLVPELEELHVLDLGGSIHFWSAVQSELRPKSVTLLNISHNGASLGPEEREAHRIVIYDGKTIPYPDKSVDLLFCNSVLEHVPEEERAGLVREIRRVAKRYVIQTPAKEFPIEPHFVAPLIHWLPRSLGRVLARFTPYALMSRAGRSHIGVYFDEVRLLTRREFRSLFPADTMLTERAFGLPKSYTIVR